MRLTIHKSNENIKVICRTRLERNFTNERFQEHVECEALGVKRPDMTQSAFAGNSKVAEGLLYRAPMDTSLVAEWVTLYK